MMLYNFYLSCFFFLVSKPCFAQAASTVVSDVDLPKVRHWSASGATGSQTLWPSLGKNALENFILFPRKFRENREITCGEKRDPWEK